MVGVNFERTNSMEDLKTFYKREDVRPVKMVKFYNLELGEHFCTEYGLCIKISGLQYYDISNKEIVNVTDDSFEVKAVALNATWNYIYK
jgi:hypothetical protein